MAQDERKTAPLSPDGRQEWRHAAALRYDPEADDAPVAVAVGHGHVARRIVEQAEQHEVPIVYDPALAKTLAQLSVGDLIPQALYGVVAEVLLYIGDMDERVRKTQQG